MPDAFYRGQFRVLLSRFKEAIDAATKYESQNPGAPEIQELLRYEHQVIVGFC